MSFVCFLLSARCFLILPGCENLEIRNKILGVGVGLAFVKLAKLTQEFELKNLLI